MIEHERTYLLRSVPPGIQECESTYLKDIYIPPEEEHPHLRLRQRGDNYQITKKSPLSSGVSVQKEETIGLSKEEYEALTKAGGKVVTKRRYVYSSENPGILIEVDEFLEDLSGLILVDFEFDNLEEMERFQPPEYCLSEVTDQDFLAGGILAGKSYSEIADRLETFGYSPLKLYE